MNKKGGGIFIFLFLVLISGFFYTQKLNASTPSVVINEVCWMGGVDSANDEWIELKNNTDNDIDLEGWILEALDGSPSIVLEGTVSAGKYFLLERSDDESVLDIPADLIYSGALGNSGEELELRDGDDNLIDNIEIDESWPGGDNKTKQTMEKSNNGGWQTSKDPGGTPKKANGEAEEETEDESGENDILEEEIDDKEKIVSKKSSSINIVINEIFPNPKGSDREWEFIELYNQGGETADLKGWWLENDKGKIYEFGKFDDLFDFDIRNTIPPKGFLAIFRSISGIAMDNNGGEIKLFSPSRKTAKQVLKYEKVEEGLSYINSQTINLEKITTSTKNFLLNSTKIGEWVWTRLPTPGKTNQVEGVNNAPKVSFSMPEEIQPGESVFFDSSDTVDEDGDVLQFSWDFGDGIKLNLAEPTHTFLEPGVYDVRLEVSDGKKSNFLEKRVSVLGELAERVLNIEENNMIGSDDGYDYSWIDEIDWENNYQIPVFVEDDNFNEVSLRDAKNIPLKTKIKLKGTVIVEPGVFGTQYFYIAGSDAFKVYNYKKDFPDISMGDVIEVQGEIGEARDEKYLKTKELSDVEIVDNGDEILPEKIDDINEEYLYRLVEIEGEILEKKTPRVYLGVNSEEVVVYIKSLTEIDTKVLEEGSNVKITGLVLKMSGELVIMPRNDEDIILIKNENEGQVAGVEESIAEWDLEQKDKKNDLYKYLILIGIAGVIALIILYIKKKGKSVFG